MPDPQQIQHWMMFSDLAQYSADHPITITDAEAHHAVRVKRVRLNDQVGVLNAKGHIAKGSIQSIAGSKSKPNLTIELRSIDFYNPPEHPVEVYSALPKGDKLDRMIDQLSQLGVDSYRPLICDRSQRKPDTIRLDKLDRIAIEAAKQCHRPYKLNIDDPVHFEDAIKDPDALIADASGSPYQCNTPAQRRVILIGPEGGWSTRERDQFAATNTQTTRFGILVFRIEAAACAAAAIINSQTHPSKPHPK
ncbi:MAG: RsmE family RNA methyltransferase [Phycisphaerales bacterium]|nr:RsmE family RNA methyltransferase [Phycisphaerales bacterium]